MTDVAYGLDQVEVRPSVVTVGNFDGVHRGHRVLLDRTRSAATQRQVRSIAVTFEPHPAAVLRPGSEPLRLQPLDDRIAAIAASGIDAVLVLPFTAALAASSPADFVARVLVERLRAERVVVGTNFRFGARAAGDVVTLVEEGEVHGFATEAVALLDLDGIPISSSAIRAALEEGDVGWAGRALGAPYHLTGTVVRGDGRGRTIGVPTANLEVPADVVVPANGVYAGEALRGEDSWSAVTNVGVRPTFAGTRRSIEVHLLDTRDVDLYGQDLAFRFAARIRGERRFEGPDQLVARIRQDIEEARSHRRDGH